MRKGVFCISIDTELLWGRKDLNYSTFIKKTKKEREIIKKLLSLFDKYNIPATWAVVGKLKEKGYPLWSGIDIIKNIEKVRNQEIASHSYSHEIFTKISEEKAENEIKDNKAKSFVFPRNQIKYLNLLKKHGFKTYRGKDRKSWELFHISKPPTYKPTFNNGLLNIPGSMYFVSARNIRKYIPYGTRLFKSKMGINKAISRKQVFHLWFHPIDFANETNSLMKEFEEILQYASQKRDQGKLEIKNMNQIFEEIRFNLSKTT